jgi:hypothetical protein
MEWQANIPPVIAQGRLFIRYGPLWAFDLRPDQNTKPALPAPLPATALWDLYLRGFGGTNRDVIVTLDVRTNALFSGAAITDRTQQVVTAKELKFEADGLSGALLVSSNAVTFTARYARGRLTGSYTGGQGKQLDGRVTAR